MATLSVRLLGSLELRLGERSLPPLKSSRAETLLAYLVLHRETPQSREQLAFRLWPDSTEPQARTNLRHVLHDLRRALPDADGILDVTTRTVGLRPDADCWFDVAAFDTALARAERALAGRGLDAAADDAIALVRDALDLYRGDLLESCYDEWITSHRDRLRQRYLAALERLVTTLSERSRYAEALEYAERLVRAEPLREDAYRLLMRIHDGRGDRALAVQTYRTCADTLARELGAEPSAATRDAYEALLRDREDATESAGGGPAASAQPPLVGRADEWRRLTSLWRDVERGRRALLFVSGDAGVGKTRLVEELCVWCQGRGAGVASARSYAAEGTLPYAPLAAWLRTPALTEAALRLDTQRLSEITRLAPELAARTGRGERPRPLPEDEQRHRLFDAAAGLLASLGTPVLLVADDVQWCDHETLRFVHFLLRTDTSVPLLVAVTARADAMREQPALADLLTGLRTLGATTEVELTPLSREATADLAARLTAAQLDADHVDSLFRDTEGNALFVVETIRAGWRPGTPLGDAIPPRVHAVIASRLDRLSPAARSVTEVAATLGRDFTAELLAETCDLSADAVTQCLDELWRARIVRELTAGVYDFTHDRIRDVAYRAPTPPQRRQHHRRAAEALKRLHGNDPDTVSGAIAMHYDRAGIIQEAITWYERAAEASQHLYASREAVRLLTRAAELLQSLPETSERSARELAIRTAMLTPVASVDGFSSHRLGDLHARIVALARTLAVELPPQAVRSIAIFGLTHDDFDTATHCGEMLRARGRADTDDALLVESEYVLGIAAFWKGRLEPARAHFEAAVSQYRPDRRRTHLLRYWLDPQVICLSRLGNTLFLLGDADGARLARDSAIALGAEIGHAQSERTALVFAALLALDMEDVPELRRFVAALESGSGERDSRPNRFATETLRAYLRVLDGDVTAGLATLDSTLASMDEGGYAPGQRAITARLLTAAYGSLGDSRRRLAAAERMLAMGGAASLWESDLHRIRAECLEQLGADDTDVRAALDRAISVARSQGARVFESRAAAALARHAGGGQA